MSAPAPSDPLIGAIVGGRYRLVSLIGTGGMGAVYRAQHTMMNKELAVKFLHPELGRIEEIARRFLREAEAASRLDHPNCITVTDFGRTDDGAHFLVMEYLAGRLLADAIASAPEGMPPARAVHIARQVLDALAHAHGKGIVHRDLKPDNIMLLTRDGREDVVKILDFGIAKISRGVGSGEVLTQAGIVFGTPEYLSPEQAVGQEADGRADLYAVGVILFEMLTGRRPFDAEDKVAVLSMHLTREPPVPSALAREVLPAGLDAVCLRALAKQRDARFADALSFDEALAALGLPEPTRARTGRSGPADDPRPATADGAPVAFAKTSYATPAPAVGATGEPSRSPSARLDPAGLVARLFPPVERGQAYWRSLRGRRIAVVTATAVLLFMALSALSRCADRAHHDPRSAPPAERPVDPEVAARLREVDAAIQGGDHARARAILMRLEQAHPESGAVHYAFGNVLLADGNKAPGLAEFRQAIATDPGYRGDPALLAQVTSLVGDRSVSAAALDLLCDGIGRPALPALLELATSRDSRVRHRARAAVANLGASDRLDRVSSFALDLEQGESCEERRQAVSDLRALGDRRAIPALERARDRPGGPLGLGLTAYNQCIMGDIQDALRYLNGLP